MQCYKKKILYSTEPNRKGTKSLSRNKAKAVYKTTKSGVRITVQLGTLVGPMAGEDCRQETDMPYRQSCNVEFIERSTEEREGGERDRKRVTEIERGGEEKRDSGRGRGRERET